MIFNDFIIKKAVIRNGKKEKKMLMYINPALVIITKNLISLSNY